MPWFKIIKALFIVSTWSKKALKDGKVSYQEVLDLGLKLATLLGLPAGFTTHKNIPLPGDKNYNIDKLKEDKKP